MEAVKIGFTIAKLFYLRQLEGVIGKLLDGITTQYINFEKII